MFKLIASIGDIIFPHGHRHKQSYWNFRILRTSSKWRFLIFKTLESAHKLINEVQMWVCAFGLRFIISKAKHLNVQMSWTILWSINIDLNVYVANVPYKVSFMIPTIFFRMTFPHTHWFSNIKRFFDALKTISLANEPIMYW